MSETQQSVTSSAREGPQGIGGWLVLPMLALIVTPILGTIQLYQANFVGLLQNWRVFGFLQNALIVGELLIGGVLDLTAPALLLFFMFKRWEIFPGWYMIWAAVLPIYAILDPLAAHLVFPETFPTIADAYDEETMRAVTRSIWSAVVWIPYMMRSERVANTFVN
jgi:hypothetical protein